MGERIPPKDTKTVNDYKLFDRMVQVPAAQHDWEGQPSFVITREEFENSAWFKVNDPKVEKDDKS